MKVAILDLIALTPNIRDVEISDKLDIDIERVRPAIQAEIKSGLIVVAPIQAPNGLMVDSYRSTVQEPVVQRKPVPAVKPSPAPMVAKLVAAVAKTPPPVKHMTKPELAIAHLRENGKVPTEFLSRAMGLKKGEYPSQFLSSSQKNGIVIYHEASKEWSLGPNADASAAAPAPAVKQAVIPAQAPKVPELAPKAKPIPAPQEPAPATNLVMTAIAPAVAAPDAPDHAVHDEPASAPVVAATAAPVPPVRDHGADRFVAGLLSNGELMIDVGGSVTLLKEDHARELFKYLQKVGYTLLPAA